MDRRMYRGNVGNSCNCSKNTPHRPIENVCAEACGGHKHEDMCRDHKHEDMCRDHKHEDMCGGHMHEDMCERDRHEGDFDRFPLAMCYVPWQCFRNLYENEFAALANGTLFKELDLKWYGRSCK
ncbi:MAG: spore coat associated protein CotJA [Herbinix sp.]|nr:spore coat associated protein CotJA [Herbinix sp.]